MDNNTDSRLKRAREFYDKVKPRSSGSAGRESAQRQRDRVAEEMQTRVLDRKVSYSTDQPNVRYDGRKPGKISDDVDEQVNIQGEWFSVMKENPKRKKAVIDEVVSRATDPNKVYTLTNKERRMLEDSGYEQPVGEKRARDMRSSMLADAADALSRMYRDGKEISPEWVGPKVPYKKKDK